MKSATEWDESILNITLIIQEKYPELYSYINEMPVKNVPSNKTEIATKSLEAYYNSLVKLVAEYAKTHTEKEMHHIIKETGFSGYPYYPPEEDMYNKGKKEMDLNPEDPTKKKSPIDLESTTNEKSFEQDKSGSDLDVPGAELDDQQESVGSEDEENNYYSIGGDNHNDLDEDNG
jgi:hypothetical protein